MNRYFQNEKNKNNNSIFIYGSGYFTDWLYSFVWVNIDNYMMKDNKKVPLINEDFAIRFANREKIQKYDDEKKVFVEYERTGQEWIEEFKKCNDDWIELI